jgi:hypothetical protein
LHFRLSNFFGSLFQPGFEFRQLLVLGFLPNTPWLTASVQLQ